MPPTVSRRGTHPTLQGVTYTLTIPILRVLKTMPNPLSVTQIHYAAGVGSRAGVARECDRLASHGVLTSPYVTGAPLVYALNRDHVLYDSVVALIVADDALWAQESPPSGK